MLFLNCKPTDAGNILAERISRSLRAGERVLWLLSGGSNIGIAIEALPKLKAEFGDTLKDHLAVTLTDERYGPVGHADSNWQQLSVAGFDFTAVKARPVLQGLSLTETVSEFTRTYQSLCCFAGVIIAQFGIGADGHTAGVLPGTIGVHDTVVACGYKSKEFTRITLTLPTIKNLPIAYTFAFGSAKKGIIEQLESGQTSLSDMPALVLKDIPESYLYSDQLS